MSVLPEVAKEKCLALHGGTAINLFVRDMPRLSVDIDRRRQSHPDFLPFKMHLFYTALPLLFPTIPAWQYGPYQLLQLHRANVFH